MAAGLGLLALPPAVFWSMTPKELDAAFRGRFGIASPAQSPTRLDLARLMQLYPDTKRHDPV